MSSIQEQENNVPSWKKIIVSGSNAELNQLTATMDKGLLIIDIPVSEERAPKKIQILVPKKK